MSTNNLLNNLIFEANVFISTARELSSVLTDFYFEKSPNAVEDNVDYARTYLVEDYSKAAALQWAISDLLFRSGETINKLTVIDTRTK